MQVLSLTFFILSTLLMVQLVYPFVTVLLSQVFGREKLTPLDVAETDQNPPPTESLDFACIVTAYRNAAIAKPLVESLLRQTYPNHIVYLVADECSDYDFDIADSRFVLLTPALPLRLKVKSILYAVGHFKRVHNFIAIFDADNLAHPHFLEETNRYARAGYRCIQGRRTAKNLDTTYAALDSLGEHYKNYIERQVPYLMGGSAVISGSGMATEASLYRAYLASSAIKQGQHQWKKMLQEDKILQNFLLWRNERIAYARQAVVFDEKVETGEAVETQRSRWLFSYFQNLPNSSGLLWRGLTRFNFNQFYFGFVTMALPMFIQVGLAGLMAIVGLFIAPLWSLALVAAIGIFALNILWVLKLDEAPKPVWDAVWSVPKFVWRQFAGLFKMRDPNKHFKPTEHSKYLSVEEAVRQTRDEAHH